jgi:hypothetical protein
MKKAGDDLCYDYLAKMVEYGTQLHVDAHRYVQPLSFLEA